MQNAIAAAREAAVVRTLVFVDLVGIIALFDTGMDKAVTTDRRNAGANTSVVVGEVAVVAALEVHVPFAQIGAKDAITTAGEAAVVATGVLIHRVAIIAGLIVFGFWIIAETGNRIAAARDLTAICTVVIGDFVAIVTGLVAFDLAVATFVGHVAHDHLFAGTGKDEEKGQKDAIPMHGGGPYRT